jgi:hypothetical protein
VMPGSGFSEGVGGLLVLRGPRGLPGAARLGGGERVEQPAAEAAPTG